jgi:uncharacterized membrane protein
VIGSSSATRAGRLGTILVPPDAASVVRAVVLLAVVGLTALAFGVRVWELGTKSLWLDEGLSVLFAGRPLRGLFETLIYEDLHPPLHYLLLHFWMAIAGKSEFAVRFLSVVAGTLAVPLTYRLGRELFWRGDHGLDGIRALLTGGGAAALVAVAPFLVLYSQEARMYAQLVPLSALSALALWRLLQADPNLEAARHRRVASRLPGRNGARPGAAVGGRSGVAIWWLTYVGSTTALLYTQYFGAFVVAFQLVFLVLTIRHHRRLLWRVLTAWAMIGVAMLPWVYPAWLQMTRLRNMPDFWRGNLSLAFIIEHTFAAFAVGTSWNLGPYLPLLALIGVLLVAGCGWAIVRGVFAGHRSDLYLVLFLLVPLGLLYALTQSNPKFTERYLIMIAPAFYLLIARALALVSTFGWTDRSSTLPAEDPDRNGSATTSKRSADSSHRPWTKSIALPEYARDRIGPWLFGVAAAGVATIAGLALIGSSLTEVRRIYAAEVYAKDDNRGAIAYIQRESRPGDAILLMLDAHHTWSYYYDGDMPRLGFGRVTDIVSAAGQLNQLTRGQSRLWVLLWNPEWADPTGWVRDTLETSGERVPVSERFHGLEIRLYELAPNVHFVAVPEPQTRAERDFASRIHLFGYDVESAERTLTPGDRLVLALYWQALRDLNEDYWISLRLRRDGLVWWSQQQRPTAYTYPTFEWRPGQIVRGRVPVEIPAGLPPGDYQVELTVFQFDQKRDLDVTDSAGTLLGTSTTIGTVSVGQSDRILDPSALEILRPSGAAFGQVRLLGSNVKDRRVVPGGELDLSLFWQAIDAPGVRYDLGLALRDSQGQIWEFPSTGGIGRHFPTDRWRAGELVLDRRSARVPSGIADGPATLLARGVVPPQGDGDWAPAGDVMIIGRGRTMTRPAAVGTPVGARIGDVAQLLGYEVQPTVSRGGQIRLVLHWEALRAGDISYTVFVHLADGDDRVRAQRDSLPQDGGSPTTDWSVGEYLRDEYTMVLGDHVQPGEYYLFLGMYDARDGQRLGVHGPDEQPLGDRLPLGTVRVTQP